MDRLGLSYDALAAVNPKIIVASISGYGHGNVWSHRGAFAAAVQAETGLTADIAKRRSTTPRRGTPFRGMRTSSMERPPVWASPPCRPFRKVKRSGSATSSAGPTCSA